MNNRIELHNTLVDILQNDNVYYQPPKNTLLKYPCIKYRAVYGDTRYANNNPYIFKKRYEIQLITKKVDDERVEKIASLTYCRFANVFTTDGLYHYVFNIYI